MGGRELRVGVPADLTRIGGRSGHGNVWRQVLQQLAARCSILPGGSDGRRRLRRQAAPDVWLSDGHQGSLAVDAPRVVLAHDAGWGTPELSALLDPEFLDAIDRMTGEGVRDATATIVPSASTKTQLVERYAVDPDAIHVVPHGVDLATFNPGADRAESVLQRAGWSDGRPYVLFVSQLHPRKNLGVLREAMVRLIERGYPHGLVVVGGPPADRADGQAIVEALTAPLPGAAGRLVRVVAPSDEELAGIMAGADVLCLPSLMEGFGMTPLEAMACGTPVIVSDRGSLPEVVGDVGTVVAPTVDDVEGGLASVLALDEDERAELGRAVRHHAEGFTWARTAAGWHDVLERATGRADG
ncbi:MAG: glycosyltransferase family 4 protein [Actinomycetota bacterium]|nr:glycosyltransferase family 4 protein [Acidimicrobiia bacterium]MDQ3292947.1 glycosyltransferase family 4 protein [Actinomycetota bacterium]